MSESKHEIVAFSTRQQGSGEFEQTREVGRDRLITLLNQANFLERSIFVNLRHGKYQTPHTVAVSVRPCRGETIECFWQESGAGENLNSYDFVSLSLSDGLKHTVMEAELVAKRDFGFLLRLPEHGFEVVSRRLKRHSCHELPVRLDQNGLVLDGLLVDFSDSFLTMEFSAEAALQLRGVNSLLPVHILLCQGKTVFYSALCEIVRQEYTAPKATLVVRMSSSGISRFPPKQFRSVRQRLSPSPSLIFDHPLMRRLMNFKVFDLSGSGFSIDEEAGESVLFPGLILPAVELEFVSGFKVPCKAQVLNCVRVDERAVRSSLAILDICFHDYIKLTGILHQAYNANAYVCSRVDVDALWSFFFETGFIYPEKYEFIEKQKAKYKRLYRRLYDSDSQLAVNFMCQDKGKILGHMSMLRFYEKTWIIHHHAALSSSYKRAGLIVLEQIGRFINEFHRLPAANMDYVACYFRTENKFPNLVFGGVARRCLEKKGFSLDTFSYFHCRVSAGAGENAGAFSFDECRSADLRELNAFYECQFGGMTLDALALNPDRGYGEKRIDRQFSQAGLRRHRVIYAVRSAERPLAVIVMNRSDKGLNMSDLTNCLQVFVLDETLPPEELLEAIGKAACHYGEESKVPVLLFPSTYAPENNLSVEKEYNLWVLNTSTHTDQYFQHLTRLIRHR